jgi:hypothetical protein
MRGLGSRTHRKISLKIDGLPGLRFADGFAQFDLRLQCFGPQAGQVQQ